VKYFVAGAIEDARNRRGEIHCADDFDGTVLELAIASLLGVVDALRMDDEITDAARQRLRAEINSFLAIGAE
jgi:hypothetical protein